MKKIIAVIMGIAFAFAMVGFVCINSAGETELENMNSDAAIVQAATTFASLDRGEMVTDLEIEDHINDEFYGGKAVEVSYYTSDGSHWCSTYSLKALEHYI